MGGFALAPQMLSVLAVGSCPQAGAEDGATVTVLRRPHDGKNKSLSAPSHVLIRGNIIERILITSISTDRRADPRIISGGVVC